MFLFSCAWQISWSCFAFDFNREVQEKYPQGGVFTLLRLAVQQYNLEMWSLPWTTDMNHVAWSFAGFYLSAVFFLDSALLSEVSSLSLGDNIVSLNGKWQLVNSNSTFSLSAEVPGCVHTALQRQGVISVKHFHYWQSRHWNEDYLKLCSVNRIHIIDLMTWPTDGFHLTTGLTLYHSHYLLVSSKFKMFSKSEKFNVPQKFISSSVLNSWRERDC